MFLQQCMDFRIPKVCTRPMAEHYCVTAIAKLIRQFVFFWRGNFTAVPGFPIFFSASPIIFSK